MSSRTRRIALVALAAAVLVVAGCTRARGPSDSTPASNTTREAPAANDKAERLTALYAQYWEEYLERNPIAATFQGDPRYNDRLPNTLSKQYRDETHAFNTRWLQVVRDIDPDGLSGQDLLSHQIFVRDLEQSLEAERFPGWMQPVNQFGSLTTLAVQFGSGTGAQPFKTVQDYDNWLARGNQLPVLLDQAIANMREGMAAGVVQPRALMVKVLPQLDALIKPRAEDTQFWMPIRSMPDSFPAPDKARLPIAYREMIESRLVPSIQRLRDFVAVEYMPKTRASAGFDALPNGEAWYAFSARNYTTTDLSPAEIHQIGLDEVKRIHGEIRGVMRDVEFKGTLQDFFRFMQDDPRFSFKDEAALLAHYRSLEAKINLRVPEQFSLVPKSGFEIRPVEAFRAQSAAGGSYQTPSEDGSRPGVFYVNTYDLPTRKTWDAEDLYLHEAIPGHHFQLALQQELTGLPAFRRFGGETAFIEGWGLYAESLGRDLGAYTNPYDYFGYLQNELWRAIRLVVDTGLHSRDWTRERVIAYMLENSAESETQSTAEAERYMAAAGQALAYKIGELRIKALRARAERELGAAFDVRAFHAEVLRDGAVPLEVLEGKIDRYIAEVRND